MAAEGLELTHLIGPQTAHAYEPETKRELSRRFDALVAPGKNPWPEHIRFVTYTLAYARSHWVQVDGMEQHWQRATVEAEIRDSNGVRVTTANVTALTLDLPFPPLNQDHYIVLNSGFTFGEFGDQSNSLQTPKLPDWAVVDMNVPRPERLQRGVVDAGFFDENWE